MVCRLPPGWPWPEPPDDGSLFSVTTSRDEVSVVCRAGPPPAGATAETGWRCLTVAGPLDFTMVGVLATLSAALASADVSIFVLSTFDTDHLLVRSDQTEAAIDSLRSRGHTVHADPLV